MNLRSRWVLLLVMLPTLILSIFGTWLFVIRQQEQHRSAITRRQLLEQYPIWQRAVNTCVLNDNTLSINKKEAKELILGQLGLKRDSMYLSVDSLIVERTVTRDSLAFVYNYQSVGIEKRMMRAGETINDAVYVVNNKKEVLGLTHHESGYFLILQTALEVLRNNQRYTGYRTQPVFFNANLCINDAVINQRVSLIGLDTTGKYLIQLASRMPDSTYDNSNNEIAIPQSLYNLILWFLRFGWLLLLATLVTFILYRYNVRLSAVANRWLSSLNKATCAIAIADKKGNLEYVNDTYRDWNDNKSIKGKTLHDAATYDQMDRVIENVMAQPGKTEYYNATLGNKNVHSGITYDASTESLIVVDTDVSMLRHMYDGELHSLKNLIQEVKELNARVILGEIPIEQHEHVLETLRHNNHTLEKALLFYENNRGALSIPTAKDIIRYDLELGLEGIFHWFDSLVIPLGIRFEMDIPDIEISGTLNSIELIFHNAIFNAIQAIRERCGTPPEGNIIRIAARRDGSTIIVEVTDNGVPFPEHTDLNTLIASSQGNGLCIIQSELQKIGGELIGINGKSLSMVFRG
jgi:hypothetical protein